MSSRAIIVGTAPSWKRTPWDDPSARIVSLNDAYSLGIPRADEWYELHPFAEMWFRPKHKKVFKQDEIPEGVYIRPEGHLEWLQEQAKTIPVWLQHDPPEGWPINAKRFPVEEMRDKYGHYWASGPSYIAMHLYDRGVREFEVYGIHLATEAEYIRQKPNFEAVLRGILGPRVKQYEKDGKRYYEGENASLVLPQEAPILTHGWQYAYEKAPISPDAPARHRLMQLQQQYSSTVNALIGLPWWKVTERSQLQSALTRLRAEMRDAKMQGRHALMTAGAL